MVAGFETGHTCTDFSDYAGTLVAENGRKNALRIVARQRIKIGMANACRLDLYQYFPSARALKLYGFDAKRGTCLVSDGCAHIHLLLLTKSLGNRPSNSTRSVVLRAEGAGVAFAQTDLVE